MNIKEEKILFYIKIFSIICIIILCFEIGYLVNHKYFSFGESIYFDSINAFDIFDDNLVVVGSNNNNENHYEKAKLSIYDKMYNRNLDKIYNKGFNSVFFDVISLDNGIIAVGSFEKDEINHNNGFRSALLVKYD